MTADPHHTKPGPGEPLNGPESASTPVGGTPGGPNPLNGPQTGAQGFGGEREAADNPLREQIAAAIDGHGLIHLDARMFSGHNCCADAVLAVRDREHAALKRAHVALAAQAGRDQAAIACVRHLAEEHPVAIPTNLIDEALGQTAPSPTAPDELAGAYTPDPPIGCLRIAAAHDSGPSVAEATADDRRWPLQREGE